MQFAATHTTTWHGCHNMMDRRHQASRCRTALSSRSAATRHQAFDAPAAADGLRERGADLTVLEVEDYIARPKPNGYRRYWPQRWLPFLRGDLYRLRAPRDAGGHEQFGAQYAVVVQSDELPLSTWVIAPTSTGRREASSRPKIEVDSTRTRVMVEQLTVIDPQTRLGDFAGRLSSSEMQAVDHALQVVLALD